MRRWHILALGLPIYTFLLMVLASVVLRAIVVEDWTSSTDWNDFLDDLSEMLLSIEWWLRVGVTAVLAVGIQAVFVIPVMGRRPPKAPRSRSLIISLIIAAAVAGSLTFGLFMAFTEFAMTVLDFNSDFEDPTGGVLIATFALGSWAFWSALLLIFCRGIWADRILGRIVGLLIAGSLLEVLIVLPLDIMVRRRTDCYCFSGTLFALCIAAVGTLWLAGPGIVIALMSRKHHRWREQNCFRCGYAKGPSPGTVCPECGSQWSNAS